MADAFTKQGVVFINRLESHDASATGNVMAQARKTIKRAYLTEGRIVRYALVFLIDCQQSTINYLHFFRLTIK